MLARDSPSLRRSLLALSIGLYLLYSSFGFAHPVLWGHFGFHTSAYLMRALASLRFGLLVPASSVGFAPPTPDAIYLHHPFGYHHLYTLLIALFGNHAWLGAVAPVLTGLPLIWALHTLVRHFWGPWAAVLSVATWVSLPFVWTFSILTDPMFPAMTCSIVTTYAFLRYIETPSSRWLWVGALATAAGGLLMWEALIQTALYGAVSLVWIARRPHARLGRLRAGAVWIAVTTFTIALAMGLHVVLVVTHGRVADFLTSFKVRREIDAGSALSKNLVWMLILYGPVIAAFFVLFVALFVRRALRGGARLRDLGVVTFFVINAIYIALFPEGTAVHLYRVFWMSTSFVLAMVDLAVRLYEHVAARRREGGAGPSPAAVTAMAMGTALFAILPQSVYDLIESRVLMGCFHNPGYTPEYEKMRFADVASGYTTPGDLVGVTESIKARAEFKYHLDRTVRIVDSIDDVMKPENSGITVLLTDASPPENQRAGLAKLLAHHPAQRIARWLMIDLRDFGPDLRTFVFRAEPPSLAWRWFVSHCYPPLTLVETTPGRDPSAYAK
jgi:hypothetical protein